MSRLCKTLLWIAMSIFVAAGAQAHDEHDYGPEYNEWAKKQLVTPEAGRTRFGCAKYEPNNNSCFCCNKSEIVKTKFRLVEVEGERYPVEGWEWLVPGTNIWRRVPRDIIHWDEPTPTKEGVLFLLNGTERCFFPPQETGG